MKNSDLTNSGFWDGRWAQTEVRRSWTLDSREQARALQRALALVPPNGRILELGIAPGKLAREYHRLRDDIVIDGVDISEVGIDETRRIFAQNGIKGALHIADLRGLDGNDTYDLVCSHGLIEHFENYKDIVEDHFRFAKPGGAVFITIPDYASSPVHGLLKRFSQETIDTHVMDCMSEKALRAALQDAPADTIDIFRYGGSLLPHSAINPGFGGKAYRMVCRGWNAAVSVVARVTGDSRIVRMWNIGFGLIATKRPE